MLENILSNVYRGGVDEFCEVSSKHMNDYELIQCPCVRCGNNKSFKIAIVRTHLIANVIISTYQIWLHHGEVFRRVHLFNSDANDEEDSNDDMRGMMDDLEEVFSNDRICLSQC